MGVEHTLAKDEGDELEGWDLRIEIKRSKSLSNFMSLSLKFHNSCYRNLGLRRIPRCPYPYQVLFPLSSQRNHYILVVCISLGFLYKCHLCHIPFYFYTVCLCICGCCIWWFLYIFVCFFLLHQEADYTNTL